MLVRTVGRWFRSGVPWAWYLAWVGFAAGLLAAAVSAITVWRRGLPLETGDFTATAICLLVSSAGSLYTIAGRRRRRRPGPNE